MAKREAAWAGPGHGETCLPLFDGGAQALFVAWMFKYRTRRTQIQTFFDLQCVAWIYMHAHVSAAAAADHAYERAWHSNFGAWSGAVSHEASGSARGRGCTCHVTGVAAAAHGIIFHRPRRAHAVGVGVRLAVGRRVRPARAAVRTRRRSTGRVGGAPARRRSACRTASRRSPA